MTHAILLPLAAAAEPLQAGRPLFGNVFLALGAVVAAIVALLVFVAQSAHTHSPQHQQHHY